MSGDPIDDYMAEVGHEGATAEQLGRLMRLTPRELQVLEHRTRMTFDATRETLRIGRSTLSIHQRSAMDKLDVASLPEAWAALGWLRVPAPRPSAPQAIPTDTAAPPHRGGTTDGLRHAIPSSGTPAGRTTGESAA